MSESSLKGGLHPYLSQRSKNCGTDRALIDVVITQTLYQGGTMDKIVEVFNLKATKKHS